MEKTDTLLLVEDNPDDEALFRRALKKARVRGRVVVARDGVEAVDYLLGMGSHEGRDPRNLPRLVILDMHLPQMEGLVVLHTIRANDPTRHLPVVLFTSSEEEVKMAEGYRCGANSFVRKPVDSHEFQETVRLLCRYWLSLNRLPPAEAFTAYSAASVP